MQVDFATVEECNEFDECQNLIDAYGKPCVFVIEYTRPAFKKGCDQFPNLAIVLRDKLLLPQKKTQVKAFQYAIPVF